MECSTSIAMLDGDTSLGTINAVPLPGLDEDRWLQHQHVARVGVDLLDQEHAIRVLPVHGRAIFCTFTSGFLHVASKAVGTIEESYRPSRRRRPALRAARQGQGAKLKRPLKKRKVGGSTRPCPPFSSRHPC